jgi:phytoene desaturase
MAPATLNIIPHVEYNMGSYIALEGIHQISLTLEKLCRQRGVEFNYNSKVSKILLNNNKVNGIKSKGKNHYSDIVISNADVALTYEKLLDDNTSIYAKRYKKQEPSSSAVVFYWGIKNTYKEMAVHSILFAEDYEKEFSQLFKEKICPLDPTVYIYVSSRFKKDDAPENCENWFVMVNTPCNNNQNWDKEVKNIKQAVIKKINKHLNTKIENYIEVETITTPETIEKTSGSNKGSIYGISSNSKTAAFMRHPLRSRKYRGLFMCGGSAHPGGGIPLVLLSGKLAAELVEKYES